ncbi:MAG: hypothetical protein ACE5HL_03570 [Terriglobia bacterium]
MSLRFVVACFGAILTFSSGVAVGQRDAPSRFERYERPAKLSEMDSRLLGAKLEIAHDQLQFSPGIGLPFIFYDRSTRKLRAQSHVDEEFLNKQKNSDVKERLLSAALAAQVQADLFFPEVKVKEFPDPDFEVEFFHIRWNAEKKGGERVVYAEYKKGELAMYHGR